MNILGRYRRGRRGRTGGCRGRAKLYRLYEPARLVEFKSQFDLCITKHGEGCIHFFTSGFLELVPCGIAAAVLDLDKDTFSGLESECPGN
jgi:hypothetical protein